MKHIKRYTKNLSRGLVLTASLLLVAPCLLIASVFILCLAICGADVSNNLVVIGEDE